MPGLLTDLEQAMTENARRAVAVSDVERVRRDVLESLRQLCSTRRGSVPSAPTYGADDVRSVFVGDAAAIERFAARLTASIRDHEPRVLEPALRWVPREGMVLSFELKGVLLVDRDRRTPLRVGVSLDAHQHAVVE
jgi:type VI secretion system lysozyme-like protein